MQLICFLTGEFVVVGSSTLTSRRSRDWRLEHQGGGEGQQGGYKAGSGHCFI